MFWFFTAIFFGIVALAWAIFAPKRYQYILKEAGYGKEAEYGFMNLKKLAIVPLVLMLVAVFFSSFAIVGTRNVGVGTVFSKPTGQTYDAGWNWKAPWVAVTDIDATVKVEEYFGKRAIEVKIGDGGDASVGLAYRWRINPDGADVAFEDYRKAEGGVNEAIRKALVSTNIKAAINEELGTYDPLASVGELTPNMTPEELANLKVNVVPDYQALNKAIQKNVEAKIKNVGDLIEIKSITISSVKLPKTTRDRINKFNASVQDTRIALQEVATKAAQASGNVELANSLKDPNVLVSKCLDSLAQGDFTAPAGFSCWPGQGSAVVLPASK